MTNTRVLRAVTNEPQYELDWEFKSVLVARMNENSVPAENKSKEMSSLPVPVVEVRAIDTTTTTTAVKTTEEGGDNDNPHESTNAEIPEESGETAASHTEYETDSDDESGDWETEYAIEMVHDDELHDGGTIRSDLNLPVPPTPKL